MYPEGKCILIVDNDAERRQFSENILSGEGFSVTAVPEGLSALRAAARERFALAIVTVDLPGNLDGPETLRLVRVRQPWLKALFIGPSARWPAWPERCGEDFIALPLRRHELLGCVFELLQRDPARVRGLRGHRNLG